MELNNNLVLRKVEMLEVPDEVVDPFDPATNLMLEVGEEGGEEDAGEDSDESSILVSLFGL